MRKSKLLKVIAVFLAFNLLLEIAYPSVAFALTGGPAQPESSAFTPVGTSEMVDLFSGDYNYNIPLLDVGGYPVNISYNSGVSMDQEASWVGLGWNINPGAINRNMRGLPDDFKGELIQKEFNIKPNQTYGANVGLGFAVCGFDNLSLNFSVGAKYNNYTGVGFEQSANIALSAGESGKTKGTASLGLHSSAEGLDISPSLSFSSNVSKKSDVDTKLGASIGTSFNSRSGLKALSVNTSVSQSQTKTVTENEKAVLNDDGSEKKETYTGSSTSTGCSISFTNPTYVPSMGMPMKNLSVNANFQLGLTIFTVDATVNVSGYYSEQRLAEKIQNVPAFGYMYSDEGSALDKVLLDFNREKDGSFTKNTPCLPLTNYSYDLFTVSGQGVGGMFRPFRSDLGYVFDSRSTNTSDSYSIGLEIATAQVAHGGVDVTINDVNSTSGKWTQSNEAANKLKFRKKMDSNPLFEPYYFKEVGEKNVDTYPALYTGIGEDQPVRIGLEETFGFNVKTNNKFIIGTNPDPAVDWLNIPTTNYRPNRQRRNQLFSFISIGEYEKSAVEKSLYPLIYSNASPNHIGEITTTKTDGTRYVYGIPAYNISQKEVTFNASVLNSTLPNPNSDPSTGLVNYFGTDNSKENSRGIDNYYNSTTLPAYAHSYLLTAVLSPDYVDVTGDGLTPDDYGNYTKFEYSKTTSDYTWRAPYGDLAANKANFNEGLKTDVNDDQGNYIVGQKEIWILERIETKNYIAIFETKDRADGYDAAAGENGGNGTNPSRLLKKISLYSRPDKDPGSISPVLSNPNSPVPIKEVHFVYDYSLCQGTLNNIGSSGSWTPDLDCESGTNDGGKLTLKKIYFTYGNSNKAKLNPYLFEYSSFNPDYGMKDYDKWGNYKPNNLALTNAEFPYVDQDLSLANLYSSAWLLNKVTLPSGGEINVQFESDDYAYVQDRQAMQMFKITGVGTAASSDPLLWNQLLGDDPNANYLFFELQEPVLETTNPNWLYENYIKGIKDLYFRFLIKVNQVGNEYVSGYASTVGLESGFASGNITNIGGSNYYTHGYIKLENVSIDDSGPQNYSPITKAALQFARIYTPRQAYANTYNPDPNNVDLESVVNAMADAGFINNLIETFEVPNKYLYDMGLSYGKEIEQNKCWIRLLNPTMKKKGGGSRVRQITISDEWGQMLNPQVGTSSFSYGQIYDYTKVENGRIISSGVASYEPLVGGDENPFRLPVAFSQKMKLAPDYDFFQEEPFGESFFPSPSVGYSKVTVKNLQHLPQVKRHATGSVVNEFYTARDYPVITKRTPVDAKPKKTGAIIQLLSMNVRDYMTASQGFVIELNDMHGKPKATWVYAEDQDTYISGIEYKYKSNGNKLINRANVINKDGSIEERMIGIDYDFVADMREQKTDVVNAGLQINLYGFLVAVIPIVIPPILPSYSSEKTRFRSASVTKVINHFGLLEETIAYDLGSKVSTQNLAYDSETGDVILTKTKNDFNDEVYSMNFPAHLAYDRMGPGYKNVGVSIKNNISNGLEIDPSGKILVNQNNRLIPGDELQISSFTTGRFWVSEDPNIPNDLYIINENGDYVANIPLDAYIKVIRSGRRNQQGTSVGSFTSLKNPINYNDNINNDQNLGLIDESYKILNAGAVEFSEKWRIFCECGIDPGMVGNPYLLGKLGNWRAIKSYTFLSDREQSKINNNSNIRKDGTFNYFRQFWTPDGINDWKAPADLGNVYPAPPPNWTWASEVTEYSPFGQELENKDALERYSAAIYGYNNSLPIAVGSNTKYIQIANDNFEDYEFSNCVDNHFSFKKAVAPWATTPNAEIDQTVSHTGRKSIKVTAGHNATVVKVLQKCPDNMGN